MSRLPIVFAVLAAVLTPAAALAEPDSRTSTAAPAPTASPAPAPAPHESPTTVPPTYVRFIEAELLPGERVANSYAPNETGRVTQSLRAAAEYKFLGRSFFELEYRRWDVVHPAGPVTAPATLIGTNVPSLRFAEQDVMLNTSLYGLAHTYLATSTLVHSGGDTPTLHSELGFGIERLPDPTQRASVFGSYFYFPEVTGRLALENDSRPNLRYKLQSFRFGGSLELAETRAFLTLNLVADHYVRKENAPGDATHTSASFGVGYRL